MKGHRDSARFSVDAKLVLLLIATYPINIDLGASIRPVDLVIGLLFLYALATGKLRLDVMALVSFFLMLAALSAAWGAILAPSRLAMGFGIGLLTKYTEFLFLLWALSSLTLTLEEIDRLLRVSAAVLLFIISYVFLRAPLARLGLIQIRHLRPDFPFTQVEPGLTTAGHLMGMYLTTGVVMLVGYRVLSKASSLVTVLLLFVGLGAVVLTGSRTPFFALAGTVVIAAMFLPRRTGRIRYQTLRFLFFAGATGIASVIALLGSDVLDSGPVADLVARALTLDFSNDGSASARIIKSTRGLTNILESGILIGPGSFRYGAWFDNGPVRVLHDFGLVGLILALLMIARIAMHALDTHTVHGKVAFVGLTCYVIGNLATEFFLVPRGSVPFVVAAFLLIRRAQGSARLDVRLRRNGRSQSVHAPSAI